MKQVVDMKTFLALLGALTFLLGLLGGMQLGAPVVAVPIPGPTRAPRESSAPFSPSSGTTPDFEGESSARARANPGRESDAPLDDRRSCSVSIELPQVESEQPFRLFLDHADTVRAWLPFQRFVQLHGIDVRSLEDAALEELFRRFLALNDQRTDETARLVPPPELDDPAAPSRDGDLVSLEVVEARFAALEEALASEFRRSPRGPTCME
jgi:hypothetical protein